MATNDQIRNPRDRRYSGLMVLADGFRPFFLLAGIWAPIALVLSIEMIQGRIVLPTAFDTVSWHFHEMLFGYVVAAIAGFLLTAVPNWTGQLPLRGLPLFGLVLLWLAGRVAVAISGVIGVWPTALIDLSFLFVLAVVVLREIVSGRNWRNLPIVLVITLLLACNALFHVEIAGISDSDRLARRLAIGVVVVLITLVGGRIIPSFTRNWLAKSGAEKFPAAFGNFDRVALIVTLIALGYWTVAPESAIAAACIGVAAILNYLRLARWRGHASIREPLLVVMHIGYLWIPVGLTLLAISTWLSAVSQTAALHALTVGAMGTMTLAVMSRVVLGHTGRTLHAGIGLVMVYLLVTLAAFLRVGSVLSNETYTSLLTAAAIAWIAAFILFVGICGPMLVARRPDSCPN